MGRCGVALLWSSVSHKRLLYSHNDKAYFCIICIPVLLGADASSHFGLVEFWWELLIVGCPGPGDLWMSCGVCMGACGVGVWGNVEWRFFGHPFPISNFSIATMIRPIFVLYVSPFYLGLFVVSMLVL